MAFPFDDYPVVNNVTVVKDEHINDTVAALLSHLGADTSVHGISDTGDLVTFSGGGDLADLAQAIVQAMFVNGDHDGIIFSYDVVNKVLDAQVTVLGLPGPPGADGTNGTNGTNGSDGDSAYEIAVANGFSGTEEQWLESLVGADGADGANGVGVPAGGTEGQVLAKYSSSDFDTSWINPPAGGGGGGLPFPSIEMTFKYNAASYSLPTDFFTVYSSSGPTVSDFYDDASSSVFYFNASVDLRDILPTGNGDFIHIVDHSGEYRGKYLLTAGNLHESGYLGDYPSVSGATNIFELVKVGDAVGSNFTGFMIDFDDEDNTFAFYFEPGWNAYGQNVSSLHRNEIGLSTGTNWNLANVTEFTLSGSSWSVSRVGKWFQPGAIIEISGVTISNWDTDNAYVAYYHVTDYNDSTRVADVDFMGSSEPGFIALSDYVLGMRVALCGFVTGGS